MYYILKAYYSLKYYGIKNFVSTRLYNLFAITLKLLYSSPNPEVSNYLIRAVRMTHRMLSENHKTGRTIFKS